MKKLVSRTIQDILEAVMNDTLQAAKSERTGERLGYAQSYNQDW